MNCVDFFFFADGKMEEMAADELPALAKEVARVEMVRNYAG